MAMLRDKKTMTLLQSAAVVVASLIGLYLIGYFDPLPERAASQSGGVFVYYGPEGETVSAAGVDDVRVGVAQDALQDADYFGAFAVGPQGVTGVWTGASTRQLARDFALASCGSDCTVLAERLPLHRDPTRTEQALTTAAARNLAVRWPFTDDHIALGGAGAWGHRTEAPGKAARNRAEREAAADCELRRAAEAMPDEGISLPCQVQRLNNIIDLRPKPALYPAEFTIALMDLVPVEETQIIEMPDAPDAGLFGPYLPPSLYGARAANGASSFEVVRGAGWQGAGETAALAKCNAERRPGEAMCVISHIRMPDANVPKGALAVRPALYEAYLAWEQTQGAGAFAISPYGAWGHSSDFATADAAIQKAADWCWHATRKNWEYRQVNRAFLDPELHCRIVAVRDGTGTLKF